jgi:transcriptional regulator with XRE-family HTH domain
MTAHAADDNRDAPEERPTDAAAVLQQTMNPLQRLIAQRLRERGWSYGEVARRGGLPRSTVYTLATTRNLVRPPRPATIDALAKGLDVPVSVVRSAAAESTGLHYYDDATAGQQQAGDSERELLIASIDELSPEDRRHVAALVESLRRKASPESPDHLTPAPDPPGPALLWSGHLLLGNRDVRCPPHIPVTRDAGDQGDSSEPWSAHAEAAWRTAAAWRGQITRGHS